MNTNTQNTEQMQQNKKTPHKVVINSGYGGFSLSEEAIHFLENQPEIIDLKHNDPEFNVSGYFEYAHRDNPALVRCVETLGENASADKGGLRVETIYSDKYFIKEYDGAETLIAKDIEELYNSQAYLHDTEMIFNVSQDNKDDQIPDVKHDKERNDKYEKIYLTKLSILNNAVNSGLKSRAHALAELNNIATQHKASPMILAVIVMRAEDFSILPKKDKEITHPYLVPLADCVITNAVENPNRNHVVYEVSQAAVEHLADCAPTDRKDEIVQRLTSLQQTITQNITQLPQSMSNRAFPETGSEIICSTKYMAARGTDLVKDVNGNLHFIPRNKSKQSENTQKATLDLTKFNSRGNSH